ncbi:MAG: hypothetical protein PHQ12_07180 [Chthoniobacteraceae bacterium]|nr:hypothetical protein [Chthoniobacteraceae bacterium]
MTVFALPKTTSRVSQFTSRKTNEKILSQTRKAVERYCNADQETLARRLEELDREWDFERAIQTGASLQILLGLALGTFVHRRLYAWSALIAGFMLMHALHGWAPPLPLLRRLGFRTEAEIEQERSALRILRGDFTPTRDPREAMAQARLSEAPSISGAGMEDKK